MRASCLYNVVDLTPSLDKYNVYVSAATGAPVSLSRSPTTTSTTGGCVPTSSDWQALLQTCPGTEMSRCSPLELSFVFGRCSPLTVVATIGRQASSRTSVQYHSLGEFFATTITIVRLPIQQTFLLHRTKAKFGRVYRS
ncbi:hypothetical protein BDZ89DRAFT_278459 [Hymenopellis radicata]|nr:hypothetical protein BDZ89DRAFT_278459 [Hymenopellis radicata]